MPSDPSASGATPRVGLVGLGMMGKPFAALLAKAGYPLFLYDIDASTRDAVASEVGATAQPTLAELGQSCDIVITMLPNSAIVRSAVLGDGNTPGLAKSMARGGLIVDMSSSFPTDTVALGAELEARGLVLMDAPVSGGVAKAITGTLAIMLGGNDSAALDRAEPVLATMGRIFRTGGLGSGHAIKALNNYVSAAGLAAACEAVIVGQKFGLDLELMVDVINASTGRNNSTENKLKPYILTGDYQRAGFALPLMAKDVGMAADLAQTLELDLPGLKAAKALWASAREDLGQGADHTAIHAYLDKLAARA
ncbi:NAD(P)-dependent oxidoreductase [Pararhodobacter sp. CCB-MM2]|uniref:NAD(P)-dependent oxidoreductase n=1 Tax=Pararhodobacter sp. CCB-MM2 TaxID=1786003 RepID=UPI0008309576|nr:NAD(P)-dependent oxidoreductase [Pararhodobacter sp. CCB-MM2]